MADMQKTVYEDYKYSIQDTTNLYVGVKYTLQEITENEDIMFKFRKVVGESLLNGSDREDSLETLLYYLEPSDFRFQIFKQMKSRVRVSVIKEKKHFFGKKSKEYVTEYISINDLVAMSVADKEKAGMVIQELKVSKLALATV